MTYRSHGIAADSQRDDIDDTEEKGENIDGWKFLSWCFNARNVQRRRTFLLVESYQLAYLAAVSGMKVSWRLAGGGKRQLRGKEAKVSRERKRVREKERKREREKNGRKNRRSHSDMAVKGPTHRARDFGTSTETWSERSFAGTSSTRNFSVTAHCPEK